MAGTFKKRTNTFRAVDESDGTEYTLHVTTEYEEVSTRGGTYTVPRRTEIRTADGRPVERVAKGQYKVMDFFKDIALTSEDTAAE